eukprot:TRINITY_DN122360_c0_g1_i1.p1 TRINITY_DN122360_c0_g1~~TRINITY_DN122360_c0_g1_i1.p1  ORF type:complete len:667 (+),score=170.60 TRINITY_DN122360_c0_g1_i1:132-2132(+)
MRGLAGYAVTFLLLPPVLRAVRLDEDEIKPEQAKQMHWKEGKEPNPEADEAVKVQHGKATSPKSAAAPPHEQRKKPQHASKTGAAADHKAEQHQHQPEARTVQWAEPGAEGRNAEEEEAQKVEAAREKEEEKKETPQEHHEALVRLAKRQREISVEWQPVGEPIPNASQVHAGNASQRSGAVPDVGTHMQAGRRPQKLGTKMQKNGPEPGGPLPRAIEKWVNQYMEMREVRMIAAWTLALTLSVCLVCNLVLWCFSGPKDPYDEPMAKPASGPDAEPEPEEEEEEEDILACFACDTQPRLRPRGDYENRRIDGKGGPGALGVEDIDLAVKLAYLAYVDEGGLKDLIDPEAPPALGGSPVGLKQRIFLGDLATTGISRAKMVESSLGFVEDRSFRYEGRHLPLPSAGFIAHQAKPRSGAAATDVALVYQGVDDVEFLSNKVTLTPFQPEQDAARVAAGQADIGAPMVGSLFCYDALCCYCQDSSAAGVHRELYGGFLASVPAIDQFLLPQLKDSETPKRVLVTGHSVGGAMAMAAAAYLMKKFDFANSPHSLALVTAGQPRLGDAAFKEWFDKEVARLAAMKKCTVARLVTDMDRMPSMPPMSRPSSPTGLAHTKGLVLLTSQGKAYRDPEVEDLGDAGDLRGVQQTQDFAGHGILEYLWRCNAAGR